MILAIRGALSAFCPIEPGSRRNVQFPRQVSRDCDLILASHSRYHGCKLLQGLPYRQGIESNSRTLRQATKSLGTPEEKVAGNSPDGFNELAAGWSCDRRRASSASTLNAQRVCGFESELHHSPGDLGSGFIQLHPCPTSRGTLAGSSKIARIQHAGQADGFVTRHMGMSVKQEVGPSDARRRNVYQKERFPQTFKKKAPGQIEAPVIIAEHAEKWPAHSLDRIKCPLVAKIPKMPDLIGLSQFIGEGGWKLPVGVGYYGNEHDEFSVYSPLV
jgi:hypothetical protein